MDREEAIKLFKEIIADCNINITSVSLVAPRQDDVLSDGFQLQIKSLLNDSERQVIHKIVENYQLAWKEISGKIIIYKPKAETLVI